MVRSNETRRQFNGFVETTNFHLTGRAKPKFTDKSQVPVTLMRELLWGVQLRNVHCVEFTAWGGFSKHYTYHYSLIGIAFLG
ncbi:hypothetical protein T01_11627 [Trichinella spiralis]|uniref:Uncharacterized protein n=2 Tax=Trichinella spiralis TaxID=6334 RepID=A0A0V1AV15_TRISP|nr:hypothetical protein T01_11627 [Trichinella spiralis]